VAIRTAHFCRRFNNWCWCCGCWHASARRRVEWRHRRCEIQYGPCRLQACQAVVHVGRRFGGHGSGTFRAALTIRCIDGRAGDGLKGRWRRGIASPVQHGHDRGLDIVAVAVQELPHVR